MKFLSICTMKDSFSMVPPAQARQLLEATVMWMNQQKKAGKLVESYFTAGGKMMAICEHPSAEDFNQVVISAPIYSFLHLEVYPLSDADEYMKSSIEALKGAEKMFPAREMAGVR